MTSPHTAAVRQGFTWKNRVPRAAFLLLCGLAIISAASDAEDVANFRVQSAATVPRTAHEVAQDADDSAPFVLPLADGFRGIWYSNQPSGDKYRFKYSGGMATYPQQHMPIAVYAPEANKTFFCFGGRTAEKNQLLHMVSYYDHATGLVARPRILLNKKTGDAHDNPTLSIDGDGHLWIFSNAHGTSRPAFIHRSTRPYAIEEFELVRETNFSYGQPWHLVDHGFVLLHTHYDSGRRMLYEWKSRDGQRWGARVPLSQIEKGQYQISLAFGSKLVTAFNIHPEPVGLNARTNMYYMQSSDGGDTWTNAAGKTLDMPLTDKNNPALAINAIEDEQLVYLKDIALTAAAEPVVLYLKSPGYESGPMNDPRVLRVAHYENDAWHVHDVTQTDHNYDYALLSIDDDGNGQTTWNVLGTTEPGPQPYCTGGELALWSSSDSGKTWKKSRQLTTGSVWNHNFPRRPHGAHPDFYALWADGNALEPSRSRLYFTDRNASAVWQLPEVISGDAEMVKPRRIPTPATFGK